MKNTQTQVDSGQIRVDLGLMAEVMLATPKRTLETCFLDTALAEAEFLTPAVLDAVARKDSEAIASMPELEREQAEVAEQILADDGERYVPFPEIDAMTEFMWMENFSAFVSDPKLYDQLKQLFDVSDKMEKFHELLRRHPAERELWGAHRHSNKCMEAELVLADYGIVEGDRFSFDRESRGNRKSRRARRI